MWPTQWGRTKGICVRPFVPSRRSKPVWFFCCFFCIILLFSFVGFGASSCCRNVGRRWKQLSGPGACAAYSAWVNKSTGTAREAEEFSRGALRGTGRLGGPDARGTTGRRFLFSFVLCCQNGGRLSLSRSTHALHCTALYCTGSPLVRGQESEQTSRKRRREGLFYCASCQAKSAFYCH